jgi:hypothetical protein
MRPPKLTVPRRRRRRHPGRRRLLGPSAATEIEEAPPSPRPPSRLLALNAARGLGGLAAAAAAGTAGLGGMVDELQRKEVLLALLTSQLKQLRRERDGGASRCLESCAGSAAEVQMLESWDDARELEQLEGRMLERGGGTDAGVQGIPQGL